MTQYTATLGSRMAYTGKQGVYVHMHIYVYTVCNSSFWSSDSDILTFHSWPSRHLLLQIALRSPDLAVVRTSDRARNRERPPSGTAKRLKKFYLSADLQKLVLAGV